MPRSLIIIAAVAIITAACSPQVKVQMLAKPTEAQKARPANATVDVFESVNEVKHPYRTIAKLRVEAEVRREAKRSGFVEDLTQSARDVGADAIIITKSGEDAYIHTFRAMGGTDQITIHKEYMEAEAIIYSNQ